MAARRLPAELRPTPLAGVLRPSGIYTPLGNGRRDGELIPARPDAPVGRADRMGCYGDITASRDPLKQTVASVVTRSVSGSNVRLLLKKQYVNEQISGVLMS